MPYKYHNNIMYVCAHKKKIPLCRLKLNPPLGVDTCVYSWLTGLHGGKHFKKSELIKLRKTAI